MGNQVKKLLVVDDDLIDAHFVMRAFADVGGNLEITHVTDSDVATARLSGETFDYVILDINMPGMNGIDLLRRIRTDIRTAVLPVIMLTSSMNPSDVYTSYASGANAYTLKPSSVSGYRKFAEGFTHFWLDVSIHPYEHLPV
ncbi:MAG TPA: response regulator [Pararhizobium sp.]|uniref:response regulator n=1 Tax=Pararhizobium sp. TaxID=1977563 RepID=UPI002C2BAE22|nr:response regulator [Pararhizobium sp.]HTO31297.1 response regulator [Pararhizobium sp.]